MSKPSASRRAVVRGLLAASVAILGIPQAFAQTFDKREPTLRERLTLGLRARRPAELAYIDAVIDTVNRGELPEKIVNRMFFWARSHAPSGDQSKRPIIYFQAGLDRVAAKMRIKIEADPDSGTT
ncbi:hypothetical protein [Botrimarina mediterranea]|uniref:Uncharacterized protein n=1 Tax=Botrimarina mediterranea TaxID=2528022 RepID=A0A518K4S1_9BACT|nr:hypothetical protein [Botrimarina mediterranea]QDV72788.1 hypothetical protein Spa11_09700 [Botrimarina mediterranea]